MRSVVLLLSFGAALSSSRAQSLTSTPAPDSASSAATPSLRPRFGRNTTAVMLGAVGAGLAVSLLDSRLVAGTRSWGDPDELQRSSAIGNAIGGPGPISLGAALYATGRITGSPFATNTGREVMRAVIVSGALGEVTKGLVGRSRPFATPGDPDVYRPGHGFLDNARASFPSGHTSAAFAAATVLTREIDAAHPNARWIAAPLLFGGATFVGMSRVYTKQHWPSDVVVGAALGTVTGYEVVAHAHGDRAALDLPLLRHLHLQPGRHGLGLGWSLR